MATLVIGLAIAYVAGRLLAKDPPKPEVDTTTPTLSQRGSYTNWVIGRRRVGPVIAWVGDREIREHTEGGKGGGGKGETTSNHYYERAWHLISPGPCTRLHGIWRSGEKKENLLPASLGVVDRDQYPSGSRIDLGDGKGFWIYWGECDQPTNSLLADKLPDNPRSQWPGMCYVFWDSMYLGQLASWPTIEYEIEMELSKDSLASPLTGSLAHLPGGGTATRNGGTVAVDVENSGANPGHVLYWLHTAHYPTGAGGLPEQCDLGAYEALALACEEQHVAVNLVAQGGDTVAQVVGDILQDCGIVLPVVDGKVSPILMRDGGTATTLPASLVAGTPVERAVAYEATAIERVVYTYADAANEFGAQDLTVDDDSGEAVRLKRSERKISMPTFTNAQMASWAIDRKQREAVIGGDTLTFTAYRDGARLVSGQSAVLPDGRQVRVIQVTRHLLEDAADVECIPDVYSAESTVPQEYDPIYVDLPNNGILGKDTFLWLEGTRAFSGTLGDYIVYRANSSLGVLGATAHNSLDGLGYSSSGTTSGNGVAGYIVDDVPLTFDIELAQGPKFKILAGSDADFLDLTGSPSLYQSGEQSVLINDEMFYVESIEFLAPGVYRLGKLIRGREGTAINKHLAGSRFQFMRKANKTVSKSTLTVPGQDLHVKTAPFTGSNALDLSESDDVIKHIWGAARAPHPPYDVETGGGSFEYSPGGDVLIVWEARTDIPSAPGIALEEFEVVVYDLDRTTPLRTLTEASPTLGTNSLTYLNADILTDFGTEPDRFLIRINARTADLAYRSLPVWVETRKAGVADVYRNDRVWQVETFGQEAGLLDEEIPYTLLTDPGTMVDEWILVRDHAGAIIQTHATRPVMHLRNGLEGEPLLQGI